MSFDIVACADLRAVAPLTTLLSPEAVVSDRCGFELAEATLSPQGSTVVSYAAVDPVPRSGEAAAIRRALAHQASWLRAAQALTPDARRRTRCVLLTDTDNAGCVVAEAVAQMVAAIHADFEHPALHYAVSVSGMDALPTAARLATWLLNDDGSLAGHHLGAGPRSVSLWSGPEADETITLTRGWTESWWAEAAGQSTTGRAS